DPGVLQRPPDGPVCALAFGRRLGDVVRVARARVTRYLAVDPGAARLGVLEALEDQDARPFREHETVPLLVKRARGLLRSVVARRQRPGRAETRERHGRHRRLGTAG